MKNKLKLIFSFFLCWSFLVAAPISGGLENALDISKSGVIAQGIRMQVIAENIANVDTLKDETGNPYRPKQAILRPVEYFSGQGLGDNVLNGVAVVSIAEKGNAKHNKVYEPDNPEADNEGYVYYPDVNLTQELVNMTEANGAFETNVVVYNTTKAMMQASLEIGR